MARWLIAKQKDIIWTLMSEISAEVTNRLSVEKIQGDSNRTHCFASWKLTLTCRLGYKIMNYPRSSYTEFNDGRRESSLLDAYLSSSSGGKIFLVCGVLSYVICHLSYTECYVTF